MPTGDPRDFAPDYWRSTYQATFRPPIVNPDFQAAFERVMEHIQKARSEAEDKLTEKQFIDAMSQALACGDFLRHISMSKDGQCITYEPYRECARLKARVKELEDKIAEIRKALDP